MLSWCTSPNAPISPFHSICQRQARAENSLTRASPLYPSVGFSPFTPNKPDAPDDLTASRMIYRRVVASIRSFASFYPEISRRGHPEWEAAD